MTWLLADTRCRDSRYALETTSSSRDNSAFAQIAFSSDLLAFAQSKLAAEPANGAMQTMAIPKKTAQAIRHAMVISTY